MPPSSLILWIRKWQPTPAFLPGESHERRSLVGYSPRGRKESDTTEQLHFHFHIFNLIHPISGICLKGKRQRSDLMLWQTPNICRDQEAEHVGCGARFKRSYFTGKDNHGEQEWWKGREGRLGGQAGACIAALSAASHEPRWDTASS